MAGNGETPCDRGVAIYNELRSTFASLPTKRVEPRVTELLEGTKDLPINIGGLSGVDEMILRSTTALTQAMTESALAAVAVYLARHEESHEEKLNG